MKITIEATPEEMAKFATEYAKGTHNIIQEAIEQVVGLMLSNTVKKENKKLQITDTEVPSGGYFN